MHRRLQFGNSTKRFCNAMSYFDKCHHTRCLHAEFAAKHAKAPLSPTMRQKMEPDFGSWQSLKTVKCRYNAVFGVQEIDRVIAAGSAMDVFWLIFKQRGSWAILGHLNFVGWMRPQTVAIHNWNNYLFLLKHLTALQTPYFVNSGGI